MPGALAESGSRVARGLVRLERDAESVLQATRSRVLVMLAQCQDCGHRPRVLPSDVLPHKTYGLPVIERVSSEYLRGDKSLREVAWGLRGVDLQHTTLHGWTEGLGAHALGRDDGRGEPYSAAQRETKDRWPTMAPRSAPRIDARRYRSEPRRERLVAVAMVILFAAVIPVIAKATPLTDWRRLLLGFGLSWPLLFRSDHRLTRIEHVISRHREDRAAWNQNRTDPDPNHTRSPPSDSR